MERVIAQQMYDHIACYIMLSTDFVRADLHGPPVHWNVVKRVDAVNIIHD